MTDLNTRMTALERTAAQYRRRLAVGLPATFLAGVGVAMLMGTSMTATERIRVKHLEIVGDDGRTMLALGTDANGGRVDLWTPNGANIMRLAGNAHGGDLAVWSTNGITNAGLWASSDGGELAVWQGDGARLVHVDTTGMKVRGHMRIDNAEGTVGLDLDGTQGVLAASSVLIADTVVLSQLGLEVSNEERSATFSHNGIASSDSALTFTNEGVRLTMQHTNLLLGVGLMHLDHADTEIFHADSMDGHVSLQLAGETSGISFDLTADEAVITTTVAGQGSASMRVDDGGARTTLIGPEDIVTLAAHVNEPLLASDGGGLTIMASGGSGAIELGHGEAGSIRLVAGTDGSVPAVEILDRAGLRAAAMSMEAAGAGAFVAGYGGTPTAIMRGRSGGGRLDLRGELGTVLIRAGSGPMTALLGPDGRTMAMLAGTGTGGVLNLMDTTGMPVVLTGASAEGHGGATAFRNSDGQVVVTAGAGPNADGRVRVIDPKDNMSSTLAAPRAGTVHAGALE